MAAVHCTSQVLLKNTSNSSFAAKRTSRSIHSAATITIGRLLARARTGCWSNLRDFGRLAPTTGEYIFFDGVWFEENAFRYFSHTSRPRIIMNQPMHVPEWTVNQDTYYHSNQLVVSHAPYSFFVTLYAHRIFLKWVLSRFESVSIFRSLSVYRTHDIFFKKCVCLQAALLSVQSPCTLALPSRHTLSVSGLAPPIFLKSDWILKPERGGYSKSHLFCTNWRVNHTAPRCSALPEVWWLERCMAFCTHSSDCMCT